MVISCIFLFIEFVLSVQEICIGIMGNLACHESLVNAISMQNGLTATVVGQLFLDDSACLSETFRSGFHEDGVEPILIVVITECFLSI